MEYASTVGRVRENVVRNTDKLFWNVARCTALNSTCSDKIDGTLFVEAESATENIASIGPVKASKDAEFYCERQTIV